MEDAVRVGVQDHGGFGHAGGIWGQKTRGYLDRYVGEGVSGGGGLTDGGDVDGSGEVELLAPPLEVHGAVVQALVLIHHGVEAQAGLPLLPVRVPERVLVALLQTNQRGR